MRCRPLVPLLAALTVLATGCGDVDRDTYVEKNRALLQEVPVYPGEVVTRVSSESYNEKKDTIFAPVAPTTGYATTRLSELPDDVAPEAVASFYRRELTNGWQTVSVSRAPSVSMRADQAYMHILVRPGRVVVRVDHDCYKGDSTPHCF